MSSQLQQAPTDAGQRFEVTRGPADLVSPKSKTSDGQFRYGLGFVFQVAPQQAVLLANLRVEGLPAGDFENGMDAIVFDDLSQIAEVDPLPLSRNEKYTHPETGEPRIAIMYPIVGGFVPLGAKRDDGTPHPHAGTGFGLSELLDFPMKEGGYYDKRDKLTTMVRKTELRQFSFGGKTLRTQDIQCLDADHAIKAPGSDWALILPGLSQAVPDGDDLICPIMGTTGDASRHFDGATCSGVARWAYGQNGWEVSSFVPVVYSNYGDQASDAQWLEPSLIRDTDGSLLFIARGCFADVDHTVRIWRSTDGGQTWDVALDQPEAKAQTTITLNQALDGTPYIITNEVGRERDKLCIHALSDDRSQLLEPVLVRDALEQFGPPPSGMVWFMDHPTAGSVRLADGKWRHLLVYRIMDRGEHGGREPTDHTGLYVEELTTSENTVTPWKF